ncbi:testis-expressed protein 22 isoform X2 [Nannospalax galili]|uniref:testis-expressed protein 22 isoform X2 n=1 Tax=Nannospalax galili TaxID=1026970 RepID=UPI0004ED440B|nr:testis-expressed protein 22 isoform X2 [Nannospalax galili]
MGPPSPSRHSSVGPAPLSRSYGAFPGLPEPSPDLTGRGPPAWSPRSLDCSLLGVEMDNRQQRPQRKMLQWQVTQEPGQQSFPDGPSATSVQPDTESNPWKDLQTQDWLEPQSQLLCCLFEAYSATCGAIMSSQNTDYGLMQGLEITSPAKGPQASSSATAKHSLTIWPGWPQSVVNTEEEQAGA